MTLLEMLGYPASLAMGVALGLTGGGGSLLMVPILVYLFGVGAVEATAYSLVLVGLVALWGAGVAYRHGDLHLRRALTFGIPGVGGVLLSRRLFLPMLPPSISVLDFTMSKNSLLLIAFSFLMLAASAAMIRSARARPAPQAIAPGAGASTLALLASGLAIGLLAGFVGAGGGFLIVPALVNLAKLNMRQAVGTSLLVIALQSLLGVLGELPVLVQLDGWLFLSIAALAIIGMNLGTRFRQHISDAKLKFGFGVFILLVGSLILIQEFRKGSL